MKNTCKTKLKIATFDIDNNTADFPQRIHNLADILHKKKFDIICFQEDFTSNEFSSGKFLNLELDYNYISIKTRVKERNSILSSSNLTVLSKYETTLLESIYFNKDKDEERAAMFIELVFLDKKILLVNTQLCTLNHRRRITQIKEILNKINSYNNFDISILCGNLNALSSYKEIKLIEDDGFIKKNKQFTHEDKVILDYIFVKTDKKLNIQSKILLEGFSKHHCLLNTLVFPSMSTYKL